MFYEMWLMWIEARIIEHSSSFVCVTKMSGLHFDIFCLDGEHGYEQFFAAPAIKLEIFSWVCITLSEVYV